MHASFHDVGKMGATTMMHYGKSAKRVGRYDEVGPAWRDHAWTGEVGRRSVRRGDPKGQRELSGRDDDGGEQRRDRSVRGEGDGERSLRVPAHVRACLFDLDGVLTSTAKVHAAAWKEMFDAFLREWADRSGEPFRPFDIATDYTAYVDGKLREDGVRSFLASRDIKLPEGAPDDPPTANTIYGLATRKNAIVLERIARDGVEVYEGSVRFVEAVRAAGLRRAVVSASKNCAAVLQAAGIEGLFEVRIDGHVAEARSLRGKPAPDTFLAAAAELGVEPRGCAVFEDAIAGVKAGRSGGFGWVVGVDRVGQAEALRRQGADIVVRDLSELLEEP